MFHAVRSYITDRRQGIAKAAVVTGGLYIVKGFVRERLDDVKDRLEQERQAREKYVSSAAQNVIFADGYKPSLKRRFNQTQEDVSYTILALIQTLADQVLEEMDVEGLTQELQSRSKARHASRLPSQEQGRPPSSLSSSFVSEQGTTSSEVGSAVLSVESESSSSKISTWIETSGMHSTQRPKNEEDNRDLALSMVTTTADSVSVTESTPV